MTDLKTWGQAIDFTIKTRKTWGPDHAGSKPAIIFANHFSNYNPQGRRFLIKDFNRAVMESLVDELRVYRELSDLTINHCIQNVQTVLNHCIEMGVLAYQNNRHSWITGEGRFKFTKLQLTKKPKVVLTPAQVDQFYAAAKNCFNQEPLADTIMFSSWTGLGWAEFSQLTSADIHLDAPVPFIAVGERPDFTLKTTYRKRRVYLPNGSDGYNKVVPILSRNLESCTDPEILIFGDLFTSQGGHRAKFNAVRDYLQLPEKLTPYCLRHTFCTWLANLDVHPAKAHKMMGHASMKTTMDYYTHINDDQVIEAYSRLTAAA